MVVHDTSITLQNNQIPQSSPGSVNTVDAGQDDDTAGAESTLMCIRALVCVSWGVRVEDT